MSYTRRTSFSAGHLVAPDVGLTVYSANGGAVVSARVAATEFPVGSNEWYADAVMTSGVTCLRVWDYLDATGTRSYRLEPADASEEYAGTLTSATVAAITTSVLSTAYPAAAAGDTTTDLTYIAGDTQLFALTGLADTTGASDLLFTVKAYSGDADTAAAVQVTSAGMTRLLGAAATAGHASLTAVGGSVSGTINASDGASLPPGTYAYALRMVAGGAVTDLARGKFVVVTSATGAVT